MKLRTSDKLWDNVNELIMIAVGTLAIAGWAMKAASLFGAELMNC